MDDAKKILDLLTMEEKLSLLAGRSYWKTRNIDRVNLNSVTVSDGPNGVRKQVENVDSFGFNKAQKSVCFPTASCSACSFDEELIYKMGVALGKECHYQDVDVLLGPGVNLKRNARCGRNFEYFSEDPLLAGKIGASFIKGVQSVGIGTSLKHFNSNNQEMCRFISNSVIDERTWHEIYLKPFEIAVKEAKPWTVMSCYNRVNGVYGSENKLMLQDILRDEWHFDGLVMTDWGALNNPVTAIKNGLNLEMPGIDKTRVKWLMKEVKKGNLTEDEVNKAAIKVIELSLKADKGRKENVKFDADESLRLAQTIAENSAVLLKNEERILPLNENEKIGFIGAFIKKPRYQGEGSSNINPLALDNLYEVLEKSPVNYEYAQGYSLEDENSDENLIKESIDLASKVDKVVMFMGLPESFESEGYDRNKLDLPKNQNELLEKVLSVNKNVVVVLQGGSPMLMPWVNEVKGILLQYLSGSMSGNAAFNLLYGKVNPSGHLAETLLKNENDVPVKNYPESSLNAFYKEGNYIGYRYYNGFNKDVLFPFGHGLSYSSFKFNNIIIDEKIISIEVLNDSDIDGKEVIQIYVKNGNSSQSYQALKCFKKVFVKAHESKTVTFEINDSFFEMYSINKHRFVKGTGEFTIQIGTSSRNIFKEQKVSIKGEEDYSLPKFNIDLKVDYKLDCNIKGHYTINSTTKDISSCFLGRRVMNIAKRVIKKMGKKDPSLKRAAEAMLYEAPLRSICLAADGGFTYHQVEGLVDVLNGHFFKGVHKLIHK